jgi:hypothetical protein
MLKRILTDREFNSSDEIKEAEASAWNNLTFDDMQSVSHNWMSRLAEVINNGGEYSLE